MALSSLTLQIFLLGGVLCKLLEASRCRCLPSNSCWPNSNVWEAFNSSLHGSLIKSKPIGSPCHDPHFDLVACELVKQKFNDPFWRSDQPGGLQAPNLEMYQDQGCILGGNRSTKCWQGAVPVYAVNVSEPTQVQKAIQFAAKHNLRLVIKNTGHDFTGRNTAPGSLSIWLHNLKNITFLYKTHLGVHSVKVEAGVQWEQLYKAAFENGRTVVGGECSSVGAAGGYVQGGGHSQISPTFGLAADNVLEYELVKADGTLVVANANQNKEIFWALRGGGGGTFGVVLSVTYATHPPLDSLVFASYVINSTNSSAFKNFFAHFLKLTPSLSDAGWGGLLIVGKNTLSIYLLLPNKNISYAEKSFHDFLSYVKGQNQLEISTDSKMRLFSSYYEWHLAVQCTPTLCGYPSGGSVVQTSRLIPRKTVERASAQLKLSKAIIAIQQHGYGRVAAYLVGGGKVSKPNQNNAVNPAWRKALLHLLAVKSFPENTSFVMRQSIENKLTNDLKNLRDLTPGSGAYINEADPNEPNWQHSFFGSNYKSLKAIKKKVDPKGLLVCKLCVGSEDWSEDLNCLKAE